MKNYLSIAVAAFTLAACSNNDNEPTTENNAVEAQVYATINDISRAAGTEWATNDRIGISTVGEGATAYANIPYIYNGNFKSDGTTIYFQDTEEVTFSAYYPFSGTAGTAAKAIAAETTAANQTTANQPTIDFLFATGAKASKAQPEVKFTGDAAFKHCMSMVTLTFKEGDGVSLTESELTGYTLTGLKLSGTFDPTTGVAAPTAEAASADLAMEVSNVTISEGQYTAPSVIVFPQTLADNQFGIKITVDGKTYTATLTLPTSHDAFKAGYNYTYPVTIIKSGLTVGDATITDWTTVQGDGSEATM